jgi:MYXO-CTERM domain-containing protein
VIGAALALASAMAFAVPVAQVPEPGSLSIVAAAVLGGLAAYRLRRRK